MHGTIMKHRTFSKIWLRLRTLFMVVPQSYPPPVLPDDKLRIHLLCGDFENANAAKAYCFASDGDAPEQITRDQPGAFIDTGFVEVVYNGAATRLADFLSAQDADRTLAKMKGTNTLVIITEDAFGGLPYVLISTEQLSYIGPFVVDV
jgi:hypothetical protein